MTITELSDKLTQFAQSGHALAKVRVLDKNGDLHKLIEFRIIEKDNNEAVLVIDTD